MDATQDFAEALETGDYPRALAAYRRTEHAATPTGQATEALLLSLSGDHAGAARQIATCRDASLIEIIVQGERERAARWTDAASAAGLTTSDPLPYLGVYAGMAVALLQNDAALIDEQIIPDAKQIPPVAGRLVFRSGEVKEFRAIADSDDGIGAMLETYGPSGLMYFPFASIRKLTFLPPRNFIDNLVPRAELVLADGQTTTVLVPLLYALSTTAGDDTIRAGRMTTWRYVGGARRAIGQRDFVLDGTRMVGMQNVASIELTAPVSRGTAPTPGRPRPAAAGDAARAPEPRAKATPSPLLLGLMVVAIVVVLALVLRG